MRRDYDSGLDWALINAQGGWRDSAHPEPERDATAAEEAEKTAIHPEPATRKRGRWHRRHGH